MKKFIILFFLFISSDLCLAESQDIKIPCKEDLCKPELGDTVTRLFPGHADQPVLIVYGGGKGQSLSLDHMRLADIKGKINIVIARSTIPIQTFRGGKKPAAYNEANVYRARQVTEFFKKKFNQKVWLMGVSNGGPRMIATLSGGKKENIAKDYQGLIFSSSANGFEKSGNGERVFTLPLQRIKYKLDLPILIVQHARDRYHATGVAIQKELFRKLKRKNKGLTELKLIESGDPGTTNYDGGHHWFYTSQKEHGEAILDFILKNRI